MPSTGQVLCTDCGPEACRRKTAGNNFAALDDASSEIVRAPAVNRPKGRGWLLRSSNSGEDIYGRAINLVTNTFVFMPEEMPQP